MRLSAAFPALLAFIAAQASANNIQGLKEVYEYAAQKNDLSLLSSCEKKAKLMTDDLISNPRHAGHRELEGVHEITEGKILASSGMRSAKIDFSFLGALWDLLLPETRLAILSYWRKFPVAISWPVMEAMRWSETKINNRESIEIAAIFPHLDPNTVLLKGKEELTAPEWLRTLFPELALGKMSVLLILQKISKTESLSSYMNLYEAISARLGIAPPKALFNLLIDIRKILDHSNSPLNESKLHFPAHDRADVFRKLTREEVKDLLDFMHQSEVEIGLFFDALVGVLDPEEKYLVFKDLLHRSSQLKIQSELNEEILRKIKEQEPSILELYLDPKTSSQRKLRIALRLLYEHSSQAQGMKTVFESPASLVKQDWQFARILLKSTDSWAVQTRENIAFWSHEISLLKQMFSRSKESPNHLKEFMGDLAYYVEAHPLSVTAFLGDREPMDALGKLLRTDSGVVRTWFEQDAFYKQVPETFRNVFMNVLLPSVRFYLKDGELKEYFFELRKNALLGMLGNEKVGLSIPEMEIFTKSYLDQMEMDLLKNRELSFSTVDELVNLSDIVLDMPQPLAESVRKQFREFLTSMSNRADFQMPKEDAKDIIQVVAKIFGGERLGIKTCLDDILGDST